MRPSDERLPLSLRADPPRDAALTAALRAHEQRSEAVPHAPGLAGLEARLRAAITAAPAPSLWGDVAERSRRWLPATAVAAAAALVLALGMGGGGHGAAPGGAPELAVAWVGGSAGSPVAMSGVLGLSGASTPALLLGGRP